MIKRQGVVLVLALCGTCAVLSVLYKWTHDVITEVSGLSKQLRNTQLQNINVKSVRNQNVPSAFEMGPKWPKTQPQFPYNVKKSDVKCEDLFTQYGAVASMTPEYMEHSVIFERELKKLLKKFNERLEGFSSQLPCELLAFRALAQLPWVNTVCETGFNAGHSSLNWLTAKKTNKVYSFDIGRHKYTRPQLSYLHKTFPGRHTITLGDSLVTVPKYHRDHPEVKCDLILVDGGHNYPVAKGDIANFLPMASKRNLVLFDDHPVNWSKKFGAAWDEAVKNGTIRQHFQCSIKVNGFPRAFSTGSYVKN